MQNSQAAVSDIGFSTPRRAPCAVRWAWALAAGLLVVMALGIADSAAAQTSAGVHRAGLVVQPGDGEAITYCVAFDEESITGMDLLQQSGLPLIVDPSHALGAIVCSIDGQGCAFPGEACFCECQGTPCYYWNYYYLTEGAWQYGHLGAATRTLTDGDVDAWVWGDTRSSYSKLPDIGFDDICVPATAATATRSATSVSRPVAAATSALPPTPEGKTPSPGPTISRPTEPRATAAPGGADTPACPVALVFGLATGLAAAVGSVAGRGRARR